MIRVCRCKGIGAWWRLRRYSAIRFEAQKEGASLGVPKASTFLGLFHIKFSEVERVSSSRFIISGCAIHSSLLR